MEGRLLISCPDRHGIVAAVSGFLAEARRQHRLAPTSTRPTPRAARSSCAWRSRSAASTTPARAERLRDEVAERFAMDWRLDDAGRAKRVAILVSRYDHCLLDLLWRRRRGELAGRDRAGDLQPSRPRGRRRAASASRSTRPGRPPATSRRPRRGCSSCSPAASTSSCSPATCRSSRGEFLRALGCPVINIHHSFLPAFAGADPYARALRARREADRGDGPLRDRGARRRPDHRAGRRARDPPRERRGARAHRARRRAHRARPRGGPHLEDRVLVHENRTVVF